MSSTSIYEFNQLPVERQQEIISSYLPNAKSEKEKEQLSHVQNLLKYLKENRKEDQKGEHFFLITNQDKEKKLSEVIFQINEIELSYQMTEILQAKSQLQSPKFEQQLKHFNTVSLEVRYTATTTNAATTYDAICNQLLNLKNKTKHTTGPIINISIFNNDISKTDD